MDLDEGAVHFLHPTYTPPPPIQFLFNLVFLTFPVGEKWKRPISVLETSRVGHRTKLISSAILLPCSKGWNHFCGASKFVDCLLPKPGDPWTMTCTEIILGLQRIEAAESVGQISVNMIHCQKEYGKAFAQDELPEPKEVDLALC